MFTNLSAIQGWAKLSTQILNRELNVIKIGNQLQITRYIKRPKKEDDEPCNLDLIYFLTYNQDTQPPLWQRFLKDNRWSVSGKWQVEIPNIIGGKLKRKSPIKEILLPKDLETKYRALVKKDKPKINYLEEGSCDIDESIYQQCKQVEAKPKDIKELINLPEELRLLLIKQIEQTSYPPIKLSKAIWGKKLRFAKEGYPEENFIKRVIDEYHSLQSKHILISLAINQIKLNPVSRALLEIIYRPLEIPACLGDCNMGIPVCRDSITCQRAEKPNGCSYHTSIYRNPIAYKTKNQRNWLYYNAPDRLEFEFAKKHRNIAGGGNRVKPISYDDELESIDTEKEYYQPTYDKKTGETIDVTNEDGTGFMDLRYPTTEKRVAELMKGLFKERYFGLDEFNGLKLEKTGMEWLKLGLTAYQSISRAEKEGLLTQFPCSSNLKGFWDESAFLKNRWVGSGLSIKEIQQEMDNCWNQIIKQREEELKEDTLLYLKRKVMVDLINSIEIESLPSTYPNQPKTHKQKRREVNNALEDLKSKLRGVLYFENRELRVKNDFYAPLIRSSIVSGAIDKIKEPNIKEVVELYRFGWNQDEIGQKKGLKQYEISRIINKFKNSFSKTA